MSEEAKVKALEIINTEIKQAAKHYKDVDGRWDETHRINMAKINGMVEIFELATGKQYRVTEHGLLERR